MRPSRWIQIALIPLALGVVVVATVWAPDRPAEALKDRWAPTPSRFITIGGMPVHYRDEGPRDDTLPLVLLHGTSASLHTWQGWTEALRGEHRVIRMDLPGFGLTGPSPTDDYTSAAYTRFVAELLDSLGVVRFVAAGNSLGGEIAWQLAVAHPERVAKLVLVDPMGYPVASTRVPIGFRLARSPALAWVMQRVLPRSAVRSSVESVYGDPSLVTDSLVDRYFELTLREGNRASLPKRFAQARTPTDTLPLQTVRVPTLVLWGARDALIPPANADRFARDLPESRVIVYPELGHVPQEEAPARTAADVRAFLVPAGGGRP